MYNITNLNKKYKEKEIFNDAYISLPSRGLVSIIGKSGIGKTTLLNILALEDFNYSGEIKYNGLDIKNKKQFKKNNIFYNHYNNNLIKSMTVNENLTLFLDEEIEEAYRYIKRYDLEYLLDTLVEKLSEGEKQKVNIILAFSRSANITILDEPFGNIDQESLKLIEEDIKILKEKILIIFVSHIDDRFIEISDATFSIEDKKIISVKEASIKEYPNINKVIDSNILKFIKLSKKWFKMLPKIRLILFSILFYVFLIFSLITIYGLMLTNYDFYNYELTNAPIQNFTFDEDIESDNLKKIKFVNIQETPLDKHNTMFQGEISLYKSLIYTDRLGDAHYSSKVVYLGITEQIYINGKKCTLTIDDIIITDLYADELNLSIGDKVVFYGRESKIKAIVETDYLKYSFNDKYIEENSLNYRYVIVNPKYIDYIEENICIKSFNLDENLINDYPNYTFFIKNYKYDSKDPMYKNPGSPIYGLTLNNRHEFFSSIEFFHFFIENIPNYNFKVEQIEYAFQYINSKIGNKYNIEFVLRGQKFTYELTLKGISTYSTSIIVSEDVFLELRKNADIANYYRDYSIFEEISTIDKNNKTYNEFIKSIKNRDDYQYCGKEKMNDAYQLFQQKDKFLSILLVIELIILLILGILYYNFIYNNEIKNYSILHSKGYTLKYYICINYFIRVIYNLIIMTIIIVLYAILMSTIIR